MNGLVLEGGGAKGAFHAGAVKALYDRGYSFRGVAGTSIGALNGAMIAQGDFHKCYNLWENIQPSTLLDIDDEFFEKILAGDWQKESLPSALDFAKKTFANRGISMSKLECLVNDYIDETLLRQSSMDYALVTVNVSEKWKPMELFKEDIPIGMIKKFILASAYYPVFRRPKILGKSYLDGGMFNNCPVNLLARKGYERLIAIRTLSKMPSQAIIDKNIKIDYIVPSEDLGKTLDLRNSKVQYNLKLGYFDALRYIDKLFGKTLYFQPFTEAYLINLIESLDDSTFVKLGNTFNQEGNKRTIFKRFIQEGKNAFSIPNILSIHESFVQILEKVVDTKKIEKFKVYNINEFMNEIGIMETEGSLGKDTILVMEGIKILQQSINNR